MASGTVVFGISEVVALTFGVTATVDVLLSLLVRSKMVVSTGLLLANDTALLSLEGLEIAFPAALLLSSGTALHSLTGLAKA